MKHLAPLLALLLLACNEGVDTPPPQVYYPDPMLHVTPIRFRSHIDSFHCRTLADETIKCDAIYAED